MAEALRVFRLLLDGPLEVLRIPDLDPIDHPAQNNGPLERRRTLEPSGDENTPLFIRGDLHCVGCDLPHLVPVFRLFPTEFQESLLHSGPDILWEEGQVWFFPLDKDEPLSPGFLSESSRKGDSSLLIHLEVIPTEKSAHLVASSGSKWYKVVLKGIIGCP